MNATGTSELMSARRNEAQTRLTRLVDNLRQTEEELRAKNYQLTSAADEVRRQADCAVHVLALAPS